MLTRIDWKRGEAVIGTETFRLLPGLPESPELTAGARVFALVSEREGARWMARLRLNAAPPSIAKAS